MDYSTFSIKVLRAISSGLSLVCCWQQQVPRRHRERRQKRGCCAGALARVRKQQFKPLLPSIFLTNARSIVHKIDDLELLLETNYSVRNCCVTKTWLNDRIPDATVQLAGRTTHHFDRKADSGKTRGGGLCIYTHNSRTTNTHCTPDIETITVICRPFYLPRELTVVIITTVYSTFHQMQMLA